MKSIFGKRFHRIPVALVSVVLALALITGGAFAAILIETPQTITQTVEEWNFGSIAATDAIVLPSMKVGQTYNEANDILPGDAVTVVVGEDGKGKWLHVKLDKASASLYDMYGVALAVVGDQNPMGHMLSVSVNFGMVNIDGVPIDEVLDASIQLTEPGTYYFIEYVVATAGSGEGTANVIVTFSLEDDPVTP